MADCGLFDGEVFVDENGDYIGDFTSISDGPGGPFGWLACMAQCEGTSGFFSAFNLFSPPTPCVCGENPRAPIFFTFPVNRAYTVTDTSGPTGLEAIPAMRVDLAGSPAGNIAWVGHNVIDDTTGDWVTGGLVTGDSGWNPVDGETWVFQCWAKIIPDRNGVTLPNDVVQMGFDIATSGGSEVPELTHVLLLTDEWQFYQIVFTWDLGDTFPWWYPMIRWGGPITNVTHWTFPWGGENVDREGYAHYGSVVIKCPHLYPLAVKGNWIDSFHGHG